MNTDTTGRKIDDAVEIAADLIVRVRHAYQQNPTRTITIAVACLAGLIGILNTIARPRLTAAQAHEQPSRGYYTLLRRQNLRGACRRNREGWKVT
jgi:hypothetical protein